MQDLRSASKIRMNRMKTSAHIPTDEELAAIKIKKKVKIMEIQSHSTVTDLLNLFNLYNP